MARARLWCEGSAPGRRRHSDTATQQAGMASRWKPRQTPMRRAGPACRRGASTPRSGLFTKSRNGPAGDWVGPRRSGRWRRRCTGVSQYLGIESVGSEALGHRTLCCGARENDWSASHPHASEQSRRVARAAGKTPAQHASAKGRRASVRARCRRCRKARRRTDNDTATQHAGMASRWGPPDANQACWDGGSRRVTRGAVAPCGTAARPPRVIASANLALRDGSHRLSLTGRSWYSRTLGVLPAGQAFRCAGRGWQAAPPRCPSLRQMGHSRARPPLHIRPGGLHRRTHHGSERAVCHAGARPRR